MANWKTIHLWFAPVVVVGGGGACWRLNHHLGVEVRRPLLTGLLRHYRPLSVQATAGRFFVLPKKQQQ